MPVLVNPKTCLDREHCFAAAACPYGAFLHNSLKKTWEVDANVCGDCPGPCLNFCDQDALRWGNDLVDLRLVKAELEGTMKPEEVVEARLKHKKELEVAAAEMAEAAKKKEAEGVIALTRANFERELLRSAVPVAVDCWADWCGPCKQFSPIFEATAKEYVGVVKFAKLDTEAEPALAQGLGVQALPTIMVFYKGQIANMIEGALPAEQFQMWLYQTLTAIRQYEAQFTAQAEEAITAASQSISALNNEAVPAGAGSTLPSSDGPSNPSPTAGNGRQPSYDAQQPSGYGKKRDSGLYIP